jgi:hypothetical protein
LSRRFIIDADEVSGQYSTFKYDPGTDMYLLEQGQVVDPIIEENKVAFNGDHARHGDGLGRKVASIPLHIWMDLYKRGITRDKKAFARWLNDSDNSVWRTSPGRV